MSECVVRMEIPSSCFGCPMSFSYNKIIICSLDNDRRKGDFDFRPDWCPILCQLPEGHGRLVDADALKLEIAEEDDGFGHDVYTAGIHDGFALSLECIDDAPTTIPAERSE